MKRVILQNIDGVDVFLYLSHIEAVYSSDVPLECYGVLTSWIITTGSLGRVLFKGTPEQIDTLIQEAYNND